MKALIAPLFALSTLLAAVPAGGAPEVAPYFETSTVAPGFLPRTTPAAVGLDAQRLGALVDGARLANSDALIVLKDGKVVVERYFDQPVGPIACMSITKAVSSLAILKLLDEGKIRSLEEPLTTWFPEWQPDPLKARITLRQVLTHTSGLGHSMLGSELYRNDDMLAFAKGLPAEHEPGSKWEYNNAAAMLLAGIVKAASGRPIDDYLQDKLFLPLGIVDWTWHRDRAGNPDTFGGLALRPRDLARIGQLMLDQGRWQGRQVLSIRSVTEATAPAQRLFQHQALIWMLHYPDGYLMQTEAGLAALKAAGFEASGKLASLTGQRFPFGMGYLNRAKELLTATE
ncbi:MAG TPA: serine hydrolase domain-containing protein, partial [Stenomitos sp.]